MRAALILGDDVLVQRTLLYTVKPIGQGVIRRAPTDQHVVPVAVCDIALTDRELVADAAGCQGSASLEEVRVIARHVPGLRVLLSVEGNAEAVLDPHCPVVAANRHQLRSPRVDHFAAQTHKPSAPFAFLPR